MVLSELKVGQSASIIHFNSIEPVMRKKLLNLGFLPKAKVELMRIAPLGDPLSIRCANSSIALRKSVANKINVECLR